MKRLISLSLAKILFLRRFPFPWLYLTQQNIISPQVRVVTSRPLKLFNVWASHIQEHIRDRLASDQSESELELMAGNVDVNE